MKRVSALRGGIARWRRVAILLAALLAYAPTTRARAASDPGSEIKADVDRAVEVVRNKEMSLASKRDEFKSMVERHFDLVGMARDSLGEHWQQLNVQAQSNFSQAFNSIVADTYLGELRDYDREQMEIVSQELSGADAKITGRIGGGDGEVADLTFKLRDIAGQWKINDYSVNADSPMSKYGGEFKQAFENGGTDGLMAKVRTVQAELAAKLGR